MERDASLTPMVLYLLVVISATWLPVLAKESQGKVKKFSRSPPCSLSLNSLYQATSKELFPDGFHMAINCLAFDEEGSLKRGIVSGYRSDGNQTVRFVIYCQGSTIVASRSNLVANMSDIKDQNYSACLECEDSIDPCKTRKPIIKELQYTQFNWSHCLGHW